MSATITAVKEFLKIPEGQWFVAGCLIVIVFSWGLNGKQWLEIKTLNSDAVITERQHGTEILRLQQRCDSVGDAREARARSEERERYRDVIAEGNRQLDQAIINSNRIITTQQRLMKSVKRKAK